MARVGEENIIASNRILIVVQVLFVGDIAREQKHTKSHRKPNICTWMAIDFLAHAELESQKA